MIKLNGITKLYLVITCYCENPLIESLRMLRFELCLYYTLSVNMVKWYYESMLV